MSEADEKPRRRQARGERRITQLLQAAARVFCAVGYTASSTSAIAREAGVSPGTLYQFFPNKESIAAELSAQLIQEMEAAHGRVFTPENARLPLDRLIDAVTDPFIDFNTANPAMLALIKGPDAPGKVAEDHDMLHTALLERVTRLLAVREPSLSTAELALVGQMSFAMFKAGLDLVVQHEGEQRTAYARELKGMLYRYLAPYVGTEAVPERSAEVPGTTDAKAADPEATDPEATGPETTGPETMDPKKPRDAPAGAAAVRGT